MASLVVQWCNELAEGPSSKQPAVEDEAYFLRVSYSAKLTRLFCQANKAQRSIPIERTALETQFPDLLVFQEGNILPLLCSLMV